MREGSGWDGSRLEADELAHLDIESFGDARQVVEAHAHAPGLDAPDVRLAAAYHEGELVLRKPLTLASLADGSAERSPFLVDIHPVSVCATICPVASNMKPKACDADCRVAGEGKVLAIEWRAQGLNLTKETD